MWIKNYDGNGASELSTGQNLPGVSYNGSSD